MAPLKLHFKVFRAGVQDDNARSEDFDSATKVAEVKRRMFPEAASDPTSTVRFIAGGRMLEDASSLEKYSLGEEAHIHVMISQRVAQAAEQAAGAPGQPAVSMTTVTESPASSTLGKGPLSSNLLLGAILAIVGAVLCNTWQRRHRFSIQESQFFFIFTAVWAYFVLWHALPAFAAWSAQALSGSAASLRRSGSSSGVTFTTTSSTERLRPAA
eukprot:TRINITY_DN7809_c0_g1_i1.p1 TRINITY_DN7809_c0_g1~~TRINITY_DN7809_c0_g1_i1.p1  ORF type:complete len:213 (+),score=55.41 TRINITY_DN7809_c0_g1_i1:77-715(+)